MKPVTVIIPASNEEQLIGPCLDAVAASRWDRALPLRCIVVANGCHDSTAAVAEDRIAAFERRGWTLCVITRQDGGKIGALETADAMIPDGSRIYLDADVTVSRDLLEQLATVLDQDAPAYASGKVVITARNPLSRAYARFWSRVPFMARSVPGCGLFAVNAAGRDRWHHWPEIISDDIYARLNFAPTERHGVAATYRWPIAEGFARLVRVRRRQDRGVAEIEALYPRLMRNEDKPPFPTEEKLRLALRDPIAFAVYSGVALAVRLSPAQTNEWSRGR